MVRRIDGRAIGAFFAEEFAEPIGADVHLGLADRRDEARLSSPRDPQFLPATPPGSLAERVLASIGQPTTEDFDSWAVRSHPAFAAANGRGLARLMAVIAKRGALEGRRFLSPEIVAEAGSSQVFQQCPLMGWLNMGLGFGLNSDFFPLPTPTTIGWGAAGGSWALADPETGLSLGYAPNNFDAPQTGDARLQNLGRAFRSVALRLQAR